MNLFIAGCVIYTSTKIVGAYTKFTMALGEARALHKFGKTMKKFADDVNEKGKESE